MIKISIGDFIQKEGNPPSIGAFMRKILLLFLAAISVFATVACGKNDGVKNPAISKDAVIAVSSASENASEKTEFESSGKQVGSDGVELPRIPLD